jgi:hypothetical protein
MWDSPLEAAKSFMAPDERDTILVGNQIKVP